MKKRTQLFLFVLAICSLLTVAAGPNPPQPNVTIELVEGLPAEMQVGESYTLEVQVTSDVSFISAMALPDMYYPGRYVVAHGADRSGAGTSATLYMTFTAKGTTADLPGGVAPVAVVVGARYKNGVVVAERFDFDVSVP